MSWTTSYSKDDQKAASFNTEVANSKITKKSTSGKIGKKDSMPTFASDEKVDHIELAYPKEAPVDLKIINDTFLLQVELPGVNVKDINLIYNVDDNALEISGVKSAEKLEKHEVLVSGRRFGKFTGQYPLPSPVRDEEMVAKLDNGVLSVTIPIVKIPEKAKFKPITIEG